MGMFSDGKEVLEAAAVLVAVAVVAAASSTPAIV